MRILVCMTAAAVLLSIHPRDSYGGDEAQAAALKIELVKIGEESGLSQLPHTMYENGTHVLVLEGSNLLRSNGGRFEPVTTADGAVLQLESVNVISSRNPVWFTGFDRPKNQHFLAEVCDGVATLTPILAKRFGVLSYQGGRLFKSKFEDDDGESWGLCWRSEDGLRAIVDGAGKAYIRNWLYPKLHPDGRFTVDEPGSKAGTYDNYWIVDGKLEPVVQPVAPAGAAAAGESDLVYYMKDAVFVFRHDPKAPGWQGWRVREGAAEWLKDEHQRNLVLPMRPSITQCEGVFYLHRAYNRHFEWDEPGYFVKLDELVGRHLKWKDGPEPCCIKIHAASGGCVVRNGHKDSMEKWTLHRLIDGEVRVLKLPHGDLVETENVDFVDDGIEVLDHGNDVFALLRSPVFDQIGHIAGTTLKLLEPANGAWPSRRARLIPLGGNFVCLWMEESKKTRTYIKPVLGLVDENGKCHAVKVDGQQIEAEEMQLFAAAQFVYVLVRGQAWDDRRLYRIKLP